MRVALHDADNTKYPNLALMKLSAYHRQLGDDICFYDPLFESTYDRIYSSKVFTFSRSLAPLGRSVLGGTGYRYFAPLKEQIEHICPDYSLYKMDYSLGFLTRGCPNRCPWCIVPEKEGSIRAHADINEFLRHQQVVLMDNNVLASGHGIRQIEKLVRLRVKVDFNQGLDCRLIDDSLAKLLSQIKWLRPVRLACDSRAQMQLIERAVKLLRKYDTTPQNYSVYCLVTDVDEAHQRVLFLNNLKLEPFAQPFRDYHNGIEPTRIQRRFARWVNHKAIFRSVSWENYGKILKKSNPAQIELL